MNFKQRLVSGLPAVLDPWIARGELAGAVMLVADRRQILAEAAVGMADRASGRGMALDTVFWVASHTKPITATALMMLVEEGRVGLDEPVSAYLPEFRDPWQIAEAAETRVVLTRASEPVRVRHLLNHTSGLPFLTVVEQPVMDRLPLRDAARVYAQTPLLATPGTRYQYSNAGINAVGAIIESVSGESFASFLQTRLFDPLGMGQTTFFPTRTQMARLATVYRPDASLTALEATRIGVLSHPLDSPHRQPVPGGGLFSTAGDCARFCMMILNGGALEGRQYLSAASVAEMTRRQIPDDMPASYGLGWEVRPDAFGHKGAMGTSMEIFPREGLVAIYLIQAAGQLGDTGGAYEAFRALIHAEDAAAV